MYFIPLILNFYLSRELYSCSVSHALPSLSLTTTNLARTPRNRLFASSQFQGARSLFSSLSFLFFSLLHSFPSNGYFREPWRTRAQLRLRGTTAPVNIVLPRTRFFVIPLSLFVRISATFPLLHAVPRPRACLASCAPFSLSYTRTHTHTHNVLSHTRNSTADPANRVCRARAPFRLYRFSTACRNFLGL